MWDNANHVEKTGFMKNPLIVEYITPMGRNFSRNRNYPQGIGVIPVYRGLWVFRYNKYDWRKCKRPKEALKAQRRVM